MTPKILNFFEFSYEKTKFRLGLTAKTLNKAN